MKYIYRLRNAVNVLQYEAVEFLIPLVYIFFMRRGKAGILSSLIPVTYTLVSLDNTNVLS